MPTSARAPRRSWWLSGAGLLLLAGLGTSIWAWLLIAAPVATTAAAAKHGDHFGLLYAHMLGGTAMLLFGALNLYVGATRQWFRWHRAVGLSYLLGGGFGAIVALVVTLGPAHKTGVQFTQVSASLATLSVAWLAAAAMAWRAARNRRITSHRDWMIRSYVLAWSFVSCRLVSRVPGVSDLGESGEPLIWLTWIVPLLVCEVALQWRAGGRS